jgi:hypothetical protein
MQDTILLADDLNFRITDFRPEAGVLRFADVILYHADFRMMKYPPKKYYNVRDFSKKKSDTLRQSLPFAIEFSNVRLVESSFRLYNLHKPASGTDRIDFNRLALQNINGFLPDLMISDTLIRARVKTLSFHEQSGFMVSRLQGRIRINDHELSGKYFYLETPNSELSLDFDLRYPSYKGLSDFQNQTEFRFLIDDSKVYDHDLAWFIPVFKSVGKDLFVKGNVYGAFDDFYARQIDFHYLDSTWFSGSLSVRGLPEWQSANYNVVVDNFATTRNDLLQQPFFDVTEADFIDSLKKVRLHGTFKGATDDFSSHAMLTTNLGSLKADVLLEKLNDSLYNYSGIFQGDSIQVTNLLATQQPVGSFNLNFHSEGQVVGDGITGYVSSRIDSLCFNQHIFKQLTVNGDIVDKSFKGHANLDDELIALDLDGIIDFNQSPPVFDLNATIQDAYLVALGLSEAPDVDSKLSLNWASRFSGTHPDSLSGYFKVSKLEYQQNDFTYHLDSLLLTADQKNSQKKKIALHADFIDGKIAGNFSLTGISKALAHLPGYYLPALTAPSQFNNQNLAFQFTTRNTDGLMHIFYPKLQLAENTQISGSCSPDKKLAVLIESDSVRFGGNRFDGLKFLGEAQGKTYVTNLTTNNILFGAISKGAEKKFGIENASFQTKIRNDSVKYVVNWDDNSDKDHNKALFEGWFALDSNRFFTHQITQGTAVVNDTLWTVSPDNLVFKNDTAFGAKSFQIISKSQSIRLDGTVSDAPQDALKVDFHHFDLRNFALLLEGSDISVEGILDGELTFSQMQNNPRFMGGLTINDFVFNEENLGLLSLGSSWVDSLGMLKLNSDIIYTGNRGSRKLMDINGKYWPAQKHRSDSLDLTVDVKNFSLEPLHPLFDDFLSEMNGWASGQVSVTGGLKYPKLKGSIKLMRAGIRVGYLNTKYYLADELQFKPNAIVFDSVILYDSAGNQAVINGSVNHQYFKDYSLDLHLRADNFAGLNTTSRQGDSFYGHAFATGNIDITGPVNQISFDVTAQTDPNTEIVIPINTATSVMENDFVVFLNEEKAQDNSGLVFKETASQEGFDMNFELDIDPDAKAEIILPFQMGNIRARGNGNVRLEITAAGEFNMYGGYTINEGDFLFQLQNIMLRREFNINRGSSIAWSGDLYDADIDLTAVYRVRPMLKGLPGADILDPALANERIPVDCVIKLSDKLFNPSIRFSLVLPEADSRVKEIVYGSIDTTNVAEMNRQMLYLLVLNSFSISGVDNSLSSGLGASSFDLLSNQISSWLSQISKDVDIGINYKPSDTYTSEELAVALSTQLFNDRVSIDGNFGVQGIQQETQTNNLVGDVNVEIKITKDGRFRVKAFNKSNNTDLLEESAPYTQGIGVFYRKEFDTLSELFRNRNKKEAARKKNH